MSWSKQTEQIHCSTASYFWCHPEWNSWYSSSWVEIYARLTDSCVTTISNQLDYDMFILFFSNCPCYWFRKILLPLHNILTSLDIARIIYLKHLFILSSNNLSPIYHLSACLILQILIYSQAREIPYNAFWWRLTTELCKCSEQV